VTELAALTEQAAPGVKITVDDARLPLIEEVDGSSFVELLGGSVMGPVEGRVTESVRRFAELIDQGVVRPPA
jgi:hypothetical protein